jgi:Redoxin
MIDPEDNSLSEVDALVGAYLAKRAAQVDAQAGLARVKLALDDTMLKMPAPARRYLRLGLAAGIAAALALAFLGGWHFGPIQASAMELVREVKRVHNLPLERCYVVEIERVANDGTWTAFQKISRQVRVCTRGDRFWVEMNQPGVEQPFVWGQGEDGSLWAILDSHRGVRVAAEQVPRALALIADVLSLNVDTLLDEVLHDCILVEDPKEAESKLTRVVRARPRSNKLRRWSGQATLEIDTEARVLRRLILERNRLGAPFAKVTFTLVETRPAEDADYLLEGRLAKPFRIYEGNIEPRVKRELFGRWLGLRTNPPVTDEPAPAAKPGNQTKSPSVDVRATQFKDIEGVSQTPLSPAQKKASLLLFLLPDCPVSNAYAPEISRIYSDYEPKGVGVFVVHADPDVTALEAKKHAKEYRLPCPVLLDPTHVLVKWTGATMAPEAAVLGPDGKVLYLGRIDDMYVDYGKRRPETKQHDLRNALDAVLEGKAVPAPTDKPIGCHLPVAKK